MDLIRYLFGDLKREYETFFEKYHPYDGEHGYLSTLERLANQNPECMQRLATGRSTENREIPIVALSNTKNEAAPKFLFTGLIHAREFIAGEVCLGILERMLQDYQKDNDDLLDHAIFYFAPVLNPDGFSRNIEIVKRGQRFGGLVRKNAREVDLNRNFPDHFEERAWTNKYRWNSEYAGSRALSEAESRCIADFVEKYPLAGAINFHSFSGVILYPQWSSRKEDPLAQKLAERMCAAMLEPYTAVQGSYFFEYFANKALFPGAGTIATKLRHPTVEGTLDGWLYSLGVPSVLVEISMPTMLLAQVSHLAAFNPPPSTIPFHVENCYRAARQYVQDVLELKK
jgi:hypothetical protein